MDKDARNLKRTCKNDARSAARAEFPLDDDLLADLLDYVSEAVEQSGCAHSLKATEEWLAERQLGREAVINWLEKHGGYCDCEVVANAAEHWEQNR
jgi:hypothetical protein